MRLPPALRPWSDWLAWFAPDIAEGVGAMLVRLDPLLGLPSPARTHELAEPDGIDGLHRRGSYGRLLLSEWAVADAMPDEFLRRAAGGEHLFLAPRRRATKVDRTLVALFDAGPAQLGAPRLAHIALWILLARRAAVSGARFVWGVWQTRGGLHDGGSPEMLARLLAARTFSPITAAHRERWVETLETLGAGERWTIGAGAEVGSRATHTASIVHGFDEQLKVAIATPRGRRELSVAIPDGKVAKRLLDGKFLEMPSVARVAREDRSFALQQPPLFSWQGDHVAVPLLDDTQAFVYRVAKSHRRPPPHWRTRWTANAQLIFAALDGRHLCGAMPTPEHLRLWQMDILRQAPMPSGFRIAPGRPAWRWCARFQTRFNETVGFLACDDYNVLGLWTRSGAEPTFTLIARNVVGAVRSDQDHVLYAHREGSTLAIFRRHGDGTEVKLSEATFPSTPTHCLFATSRKVFAAVAVETATPKGPRWFVDTMPAGSESRTQAPREVELGDNWKVVGLLRQEGNGEPYGLLALDDTRRQLFVAGRAGPAIHVARHAIAAASTSPDGTHIALIDHSRTLTVLDADGQVLLQTQGPDHG